MKLSLKWCFQPLDTLTAMVKKHSSFFASQPPISNINATAIRKKRHRLPHRLRNVLRRFLKRVVQLTTRDTTITISTSFISILSTQGGTDPRLSTERNHVVDSGFFIRSNSIVDGSNSSGIHSDVSPDAPIAFYTLVGPEVPDVDMDDLEQLLDTFDSGHAEDRDHAINITVSSEDIAAIVDSVFLISRESVSPEDIPTQPSPLPFVDGGDLHSVEVDLPFSVPVSPAPPAATQHVPVDNGVIGGLPNELLAQIFLYVIHDWDRSQLQRETLTQWSHSSSYQMQILLCSVCSFWRTLIFGSPLMWNSISTSVGQAPITDDDIDKLLFAIRHRRGTDFDSVSCDVGPGPWTPNTERIMDITSRELFRCKTAQITLHGNIDDADGVLDSPRLEKDVPNLQGFFWASPHRIDSRLPPKLKLPWSHLWPPDILATSQPHPTASPTQIFPKFTLPWAQLITISLQCPLSAMDCYNILSACPLLQDVGFVGVFESLPRTWEALPPIRASALSSLAMKSTAPLYSFFNAIDFCGLKLIELHLKYPTIDGNAGRIQALNVKWHELEYIILHCDLDLTDAYQLFQCCHEASRIAWHNLTTPNLPRAPSTKTELVLPKSLDLTITPDTPAHFSLPLLNLMVTAISNARQLTLSSLPWKPLRHSTFDFLEAITLTKLISVTQCLEVLRKSPNLRQATLAINESDCPPPGIIEASRLTSLELSASIDDLEPLFDRIVAPAIMSIDLTGTTNRGPGSIHHGLYSLVYRSSAIWSSLFPDSLTERPILKRNNFNLDDAELQSLRHIARVA